MNNNRWGPGEYLTVLGIGNLLYALFGNLSISLAAGLSMLRFVALAFIAAWITIGGYLIYEVTPWWVYVIILVALCTFVFLIGYNHSIAKKKNNELERQQRQEFTRNLFFAETYLANLDFHYFNFEKENYVAWLTSNNLLRNFRDWSDTERLQTLGAVTGKFYVCDLMNMTSEQKAAQRDAAWDRKRREQREKQLMINAEHKRRVRSLHVT